MSSTSRNLYCTLQDISECCTGFEIKMYRVLGVYCAGQGEIERKKSEKLKAGVSGEEERFGEVGCSRLGRGMGKPAWRGCENATPATQKAYTVTQEQDVTVKDVPYSARSGKCFSSQNRITQHQIGGQRTGIKTSTTSRRKVYRPETPLVGGTKDRRPSPGVSIFR